MLILSFGSKSCFGDDLGRYDMLLFGQMPLGNSVAMAAPKVTGDQKLFERVCYRLVKKPCPTGPITKPKKVKRQFIIILTFSLCSGSCVQILLRVWE